MDSVNRLKWSVCIDSGSICCCGDNCCPWSIARAANFRVPPNSPSSVVCCSSSRCRHCRPSRQCEEAGNRGKDAHCGNGRLASVRRRRSHHQSQHPSQVWSCDLPVAATRRIPVNVQLYGSRRVADTRTNWDWVAIGEWGCSCGNREGYFSLCTSF